MRPTPHFRLVEASDYMIETYFYESRNAIPHTKLQQWWERERPHEELGEWRDVPLCDESDTPPAAWSDPFQTVMD